MSKYRDNGEVIEKRKARFLSTIITGFLVIAIIFLIMVIGYKAIFINIQISGNSMLPTLHNGELYVANKLSVPHRGDLTVINISEKGHNGQGYWIIKRVIGIEGDTIKIEDGKVYRKLANESDFSLLDEEYTQGVTAPLNGNSQWVVGFNEFFFLGDNRENSSDSRVYGKRSLDDIVGVVTEWSAKQQGFWYTFNKVANIPSKIISTWNSTTGE